MQASIKVTVINVPHGIFEMPGSGSRLRDLHLEEKKVGALHE
jgi:hypothetical protein